MSNSFRASVITGDVTNNNLLVSHLGANHYRLEEAPLCEADVFYKDVIEAVGREDGSLLFQKVVEESGRKNYNYLLPRSVFETEEFERLIEKGRSGGRLLGASVWRDFIGQFATRY